MVAGRSRTTVATKAFLGGLFGGKKEEASSGGAASSFYICIDCGFIYDGDFKKAPASYKCPACNSPKSRCARGSGVCRGTAKPAAAA